MKKIRRLYLQNAAGQRYGLNGEKGVYVSGLSGLGLMLSPVFADLSRGFFIPVSDESDPQGTIAFSVFFTQNAYATYRAFVDWLFNAGTITLVYIPTGDQEFFRDVTLNFMQKGELDAVGWLEVPGSLFCNTPWYRPVPTSLVLETSDNGDIKRYDYEYSPELRYGSDSTAALSGTIAGAGHIPGALTLRYYGSITTPKIRLVGMVSGKTYGVCSIATVLSSTDTLEFSTKYENSYAKKISASGEETDLLDVLDLSTEPFFHIPVNEPCTISMESSDTFSGRADILVYYYYRSV